MPYNLERIRRLNDICRQNPYRHSVFLTPWIKKQPLVDRKAILKKVAEYNNFTPINDPYQEHDMGVFKYKNEKLFWKIDYYDTDMQLASLDPANNTTTNRVLTIMHSSEY